VNWPLLALLALAAARATHLVADDIFPFGWIREAADKKVPYLGHGLRCTFCVSIWAGAASAALAVWQGWAPEGFWVFVVLWWAFAQTIVLLESVVERLNQS
jgi:hypothetical protein